MLYREMKRIFLKPIYFLLFSVVGFLFFFMIEPDSRFDYCKPLDKTEFIYFHLTEDYENNNTLVYVTENWCEKRVQLSEAQRIYMYKVIKAMNPEYSKDEKMSEVDIRINYSELKGMLKELEKILGEKSFYYTVYDKVSYGMYAFQRYYEENYNEHEKNFLSAYQAGISNAYARIGSDGMGVLLGLLCIIFSFRVFYEERVNKIEAYVFTSNISTVKYVLIKFFSIAIPIAALSVLLTIFEYLCFSYWNHIYAYGYDISLLSFVKSTICIVFPTIAVVIAISLFMGVLFANQLYTMILQFILYYVSISGTIQQGSGLNVVIRYGAFDDYLSYEKYASMIAVNRIIMVVLSVILLMFTANLYERKRTKEIILRNSIERSGVRKRKNSIQEHGLLYYFLKQIFGWNIAIYAIYIFVMLPIAASANMNSGDIAIVGENIVIFASMFLFIKLSNYEYSVGVDGFINTSRLDYGFLVLIRLLLASSILFVMVEMPCLFLCIINKITIGRWCFGVYLSSLFIGLFSLLAAEISEDSLLGYFFYIFYYFANVIIGKSFPINLLGYTLGISNTKFVLILAIISVTLLLMFCIRLKSKGIGVRKLYENRN